MNALPSRKEARKLMRQLVQSFNPNLGLFIGNGGLTILDKDESPSSLGLSAICIEDVFYQNGKRRVTDKNLAAKLRALKRSEKFIIEYPSIIKPFDARRLSEEHNAPLFFSNLALDREGYSPNKDFRAIFQKFKKSQADCKTLFIDPDDAAKNSRDHSNVFLYVSVGEVEKYRAHYSAAKSLVLKSNPNWPDNYLVRFWEDKCADILSNYMRELRAQFPWIKGFFLDVLDAWERIG
jgi:endo-alpha-1,4-polygalactosaminidase (GH114 family)